MMGGAKATRARRTGRQWLMLTLSAAIAFSLYYCYDLPSSTSLFLLSHMTKQREGSGRGAMDESTFQYIYSLLYSAYSIPNIVLPLVLGRIVDRKSLKEHLTRGPTFAERTLVVLTLLMALGHVLFVVGVQSVSVFWMILGRLLFGAGAESISVVQSRLLMATIASGAGGASFSDEEELASIMSMMSAVASLGSIVTMLASPRIAMQYGLMSTMWIGVVLCGLVVSMALTLVCLRSGSSSSAGNAAGSVRKVSMIKRHSSAPSIVQGESCMIALTARDPRSRGLVLTLLGTVSFVFTAAVYPFRNISQQYLTACFYPSVEDTHKVSLAMAFMDSIAIFLGISQLLFPRVFRHIVHPMEVTIAGAVFFVAGHAALLASSWVGVSPFYALSVLGLADAAVMWGWSIVPLILPVSYQTTAYGLMTAVVNLSITCTPPVIAKLVTVGEGKRWGAVAVFFVGMGCIGFVAACLLWYVRQNAPKSLASFKETVPSGKGDAVPGRKQDAAPREAP